MNARAIADQVVKALEPDLVKAIGNDPLAGAAQLGLSVEALSSVPSRGLGGWCDGASFVDEGRIMYRPSAGLRENFTICHELGHHLLRLNDDAMDWVHDQVDADGALEELCDKFAAAILVPDKLTREILSSEGFTSAAVVRLFDSTSASRLCCAVAIVDHLPANGFVAIIDPATMEIWGAARKGGTSPAAFRGQRVPPSHALHRLAEGNPTIRIKSWWPLGANERWTYYVDATRDGNWDIAVFVEDDLWEIDDLHLTQPERVRYDGEISCPCGYSGKTSWFPCKECEGTSCPKCHKCKCDWREQRTMRITCGGCFLSVRDHLIVDGLCDGCRQ